MELVPPKVMRFSVAGRTWHELEFKDGQLCYSTGHDVSDSATTRLLTPTPEQWARFWEAVEEIGVWKWKSDYSNHNVLDGTSWSLELRRKWRAVKSHGSNGYPGGNEEEEYGYGPDSAFANFLRALEQLTGAKWNR